MKNNYVLALSAAMLCTLFAHAQTPTVTVDGSPTPLVTVTPFTQTRFPYFNKIFEESPAAAQVQPAAIVLGNAADKPIIGVAVKWTLVGTDGTETSVSSFSHSYLVPHSPPLAERNKYLLIAPDMFVPESALTARGLSGPVPSESTLGQFVAAKQLRFAIDAIIFADGEIVGPNASAMIKTIKDRYVAATLVVKCVREARSQGKDPIAGLRTLPTSGSAWNRDINKHVASLAAQLLHTAHFEATLEYFASLPEPPRFYRRNGSQP